MVITIFGLLADLKELCELHPAPAPHSRLGGHPTHTGPRSLPPGGLGSVPKGFQSWSELSLKRGDMNLGIAGGVGSGGSRCADRKYAEKTAEKGRGREKS